MTIKVIHGDARHVLRTMDLARFAVALVDPPYGVKHRSNRGSKRSSGGPGAKWRGQTIAGDQDTSVRDDVISYLVEQDVPAVACFGSWKAPPPPMTLRGGVPLIWDKGGGAGCGDVGFPWRPSYELIYVGGPGWAGKRTSGVLQHTIATATSGGGSKRVRWHQHEKPVSLLCELLRKVANEGDVLVPFAGSGSELIAAALCGRNAVGVEIDAETVETCQRRTAQGLLFQRVQAGLFGQESTA